jgi:hypothetical protein
MSFLGELCFTFVGSQTNFCSNKKAKIGKFPFVKYSEASFAEPKKKAHFQI